MNRITQVFNYLKGNNKKAFIGYITAGDPSLDKTEQLVYALEEAGTDIVEIGIPYSDPLADGPILQKAASRALKNNNLSINDIMKTIKKIRNNTEIPLVFLVYINTIIVYGKAKFIRACQQAGIDGLIIPDLPLEERDEILPLINTTNIALIPIVAPTSKDRIRTIINGGKGFVYCVSSLGVTGESSGFYPDVTTYLNDVKRQSHIPIAVGFGISNANDVKQLKTYVDGIIVGSAIVKKIDETNGDTELVKTCVKELITVL